MDIPEAGLHVVAVGPFLILELKPEQRDLAAKTTVTVLNVDLDDAVERQVAAGAEIVQERWDGPVGAGTRLRHPDGLVVDTFSTAPPRMTSTSRSGVHPSAMTTLPQQTGCLVAGVVASEPRSIRAQLTAGSPACWVGERGSA